jgi:hypothetical protein
VAGFRAVLPNHDSTWVESSIEGLLRSSLIFTMFGGMLPEMVRPIMPELTFKLFSSD